MDAVFLAEARERYIRANRRGLEWMLARPKIDGIWLNTKLNSLELRDYTEADGWRGPGVMYGWIQGRGLEALIAHADFFRQQHPTLGARLLDGAQALYRNLARLYQRDGHGYFAYDRHLEPIVADEQDRPRPQRLPAGWFGYADIFFLKGLIAASAHFEPEATPQYVTALLEVVRAVEERRFVLQERQAIVSDTLENQAEDYGPRMILLGAVGLLRSLGFETQASFGRRFVKHVLEHHVENGSGGLAAGLTRDQIGLDHCNAGHAIEFVGFALETLGEEPNPVTLRQLEQVLISSFFLAFASPGIQLSVRVTDAVVLNPYRPWWSLPETIRAASLAYQLGGNPTALEIWQTADQHFFKHYWRGDPPIAYQTLDARNAVDFVPATPDLDPGYHTGLSLLGGIRVIDRLLSTSKP